MVGDVAAGRHPSRQNEHALVVRAHPPPPRRGNTSFERRDPCRTQISPSGLGAGSCVAHRVSRSRCNSETSRRTAMASLTWPGNDGENDGDRVKARTKQRTNEPSRIAGALAPRLHRQTSLGIDRSTGPHRPRDPIPTHRTTPRSRSIEERIPLPRGAARIRKHARSLERIRSTGEGDPVMRQRAEVPRPGPFDPSLRMQAWTRGQWSRSIGLRVIERPPDRPPPDPPSRGSATDNGPEGGAHHE